MSRITTNRRNLRKAVEAYAKAYTALAQARTAENDRAVLQAWELVKRRIDDLEWSVRSNERSKWT